MKKLTVTLIAGLFATAAFAQTPATHSPSATSEAHATTDTKTPKAAFVPNENLKGSTQTDGKLVKKVSKVTATYQDYGADVNITAPPASQIETAPSATG